jgi:hypothetical protein
MSFPDASFFFPFFLVPKKKNPVTKFLTPPLVSKRKKKCNAPLRASLSGFEFSAHFFTLL